MNKDYVLLILLRKSCHNQRIWKVTKRLKFYILNHTEATFLFQQGCLSSRAFISLCYCSQLYVFMHSFLMHASAWVSLFAYVCVI